MAVFERESKEVVKSVLFVSKRRCTDVEVQNGWFVVQVSSSGDEDGEKGRYHMKVGADNILVTDQLWPIWQSKTLRDSCSAVIGSKLYSIGGCVGTRLASPKVYVADLSSIYYEWEEIPEMHERRSYAQAVVVDEKLYVFGGIYIYDYDAPLPSHWAEVYDPKTQQWHLLAEPPVYPRWGRMFALYDCHSRKIFVGSENSEFLLTYDVSSDEWEAADYGFRIHTPVTVPILYDGRLYWISDNMVSVYDLHLKRMFYAHLVYDAHRGFLAHVLQRRLKHSSYVDLDWVIFHIDGDLFCLVWLCPPSQVCFSNIQISISKINQHLGVSARVLSTANYYLGSYSPNFIDALLLPKETSLSRETGELKLEGSASGTKLERECFWNEAGRE